MNFVISDLIVISSGHLIDPRWSLVVLMEGTSRKAFKFDRDIRDFRPLTRASTIKSLPSSYFSIESLLVLICLTASLLLLPLVLPPLPPPPFMLLLVPIGIILVLLILAFVPSDVRDIATSYS